MPETRTNPSGRFGHFITTHMELVQYKNESDGYYNETHDYW